MWFDNGNEFFVLAEQCFDFMYCRQLIDSQLGIELSGSAEGAFLTAIAFWESENCTSNWAQEFVFLPLW